MCSKCKLPHGAVGLFITRFAPHQKYAGLAEVLDCVFSGSFLDIQILNNSEYHSKRIRIVKDQFKMIENVQQV